MWAGLALLGPAHSAWLLDRYHRWLVPLLNELQKSKAALQTKQKQEVQQQQQRKQQQPLQLANQPCTAAANSVGCGSKAAAGPEMTAKAAAMFKTVAASVGAALQQDKAAVDGGSPVNPSPQCSSVPKVSMDDKARALNYKKRDAQAATCQNR
jgi:hypothetical protein